MMSWNWRIDESNCWARQVDEFFNCCDPRFCDRVANQRFEGYKHYFVLLCMYTYSEVKGYLWLYHCIVKLCASACHELVERDCPVLC
jgi:hypothetical protein